MTDFVVAREAAEKEFERWVNSMGLVDKLNDESLDQEDKKNLASAKDSLIRAIERGHLAVNDEGEFEYTPQAGAERKPICFAEPDGAALMVIDTIKESEPVKRQFALLAAITGQPKQLFAKMKQRDLDVLNKIVALFLG